MENPFRRLMGGNRTPKAETPFPKERFYGSFNADERHDIYAFTKELTEYLAKHDVKNVMFIDRGARPAWVGVHEYWKEHFPEQPLPGLYFINPKSISEDEKEALREELYKTVTHLRFDEIEQPWPARAVDTTKQQEEFKQTYKKLMQDTNEPLVVFDTCSHTGGTIHPIVSMLKELGFKDTRVLTANRPNMVSSVETEKNLDKNTRLISCNPFDVDTLVEKGDKIISERAKNDRRAKGIRIRREIRQIIRDQGK